MNCSECIEFVVENGKKGHTAEATCHSVAVLMARRASEAEQIGIFFRECAYMQRFETMLTVVVNAARRTVNVTHFVCGFSCKWIERAKHIGNSINKIYSTLHVGWQWCAVSIVALLYVDRFLHMTTYTRIYIYWPTLIMWLLPPHDLSAIIFRLGSIYSYIFSFCFVYEMQRHTHTWEHTNDAWYDWLPLAWTTFIRTLEWNIYLLFHLTSKTIARTSNASTFLFGSQQKCVNLFSW